ncbi:hypothetical protein ACIBFB_18775 [Nocardiopsis sp. NPDC050513]|uniref:hypothetical protein n=1 Tax=Nocardiopsis sp. NPDC050513 TaxID=3364338 RepID=UPI00378AA37A
MSVHTVIDFDDVPRVPRPELPDAWLVRDVEATSGAGPVRAFAVTRAEREGEAVRLELSRAVHGRWRGDYPVGARDIVLDVLGMGLSGSASAAVRATADELIRLDPACRRILAPCPVSDLVRMAMLEEAGFAFVTEVDTDEGTYGLLLRMADHRP